MAVTRLILLISLPMAGAFESEILSDIMTPVADERRALEIKSDQFWEVIKKAAQETKIDEHLPVYAEAEAALKDLPAENDHVRGLLEEALLRLRRADETVLQQAVESREIADEKLASGPGAGSMFSSFMTGGQNFLSLAVKKFVGGGEYTGKVEQQISGRQADILPTLRGAASRTSDVLGDCRLSSKLSFDLLKYDIYNKGVPKTPAAAKAAAYKLVDASGQTRHNFMQGIVGMANAIKKDVEEKYVAPSAKVTQSIMMDMKPLDLKPFGAQVASEDSGFKIEHEEEKIMIGF